MSSERPLRIDVHTHTLPSHFPNFSDKFGYAGKHGNYFIRLDHHKPTSARMLRASDGSLFREVPMKTWDVKERLRECDEAGVDVQVRLACDAALFSHFAGREAPF